MQSKQASDSGHPHRELQSLQEAASRPNGPDLAILDETRAAACSRDAVGPMDAVAIGSRQDGIVADSRMIPTD